MNYLSAYVEDLFTAHRSVLQEYVTFVVGGTIMCAVVLGVDTYNKIRKGGPKGMT